MCRKILLLFAMAQLTALVAWGQTQASKTVSGQGEDAPDITAHQAYDYALGPGDVIEITVIGIPTLDNEDFALDAQGTISLPYLGEVELHGMTCREAEAKIASLFGDSLLVDPQVAIRVKAYRSQSFYVFGAVHKPGLNQLTGDTYLLDALNSAGGLTERADHRIQIHRRGTVADASLTGKEPGMSADSPGVQADQTVRTLDIDLTGLLDEGDMSLNIRIRSGDIISVPERRERFFYVLGDVPNPGPYSMPKNEDITLSKAIAMAGGLLPTASGKKTTIMRPNPDGVSATQIEADASAVIKGQGRDVEIVENDIVLVPGSASKTMGRSFMGGITGFITSMLLWGLR